MWLNRRSRYEALFRLLAQVVCIVVTISVGATACRSADCALLATCPSPVDAEQGPNGQSAQADAGADASRAATARGPNCTGMGPVCGPSSADDCCASTVIPGGPFKRSYDGVLGDEFNDPTFVATVSAFRLDVYEITIGRFRAFVVGYPENLPRHGSGKNPSDPTDPGWSLSWNAEMPSNAVELGSALRCDEAIEGWTDVPAGAETQPMSCMTWYEAFAFCIWDGGRLPTEAEWNYAASGGDQQRVYPWSSPPSSTKADEGHAVFGSMPILPVGSKPAGIGRWGQADLGGSVAEWTMDLWRSPYGITPCHDCMERGVGLSTRTLRGGSVFFAESNMRAALRSSSPPSDRRYIFGARCARSP